MAILSFIVFPISILTNGILFNNLIKFSYWLRKNETAFATPLTAIAKPWTALVNTKPIALAIASKSSVFSSINLFNPLNSFLSSSKNSAPATVLLKLNNLSPSIDKVPVKVVDSSSVAFPNLPFLLKTFSNAFIVSSADTVAPAENPSISLTPFSLKMSAAAIPPANDLCICSAAVLKSIPVTAATLPVISNIFESLSASPATTARLPEAAWICSSEKGTLAANLAITS